MSNEADVIEAVEPRTAPPKSEIVRKLLSRRSGATVEELGAATAWKPHSVRAYLSGLRKKGSNVARQERREGTKAYRLLKGSPAPASEQ